MQNIPFYYINRVYCILNTPGTKFMKFGLKWSNLHFKRYKAIKFEPTWDWLESSLEPLQRIHVKYFNEARSRMKVKIQKLSLYKILYKPSIWSQKNIFLDIDLAFKDGIILVWNHDLIKIISATDMSNLTKMDWIEIKLNIGIILALIMEYLMIKVEYNFLYQKYP